MSQNLYEQVSKAKKAAIQFRSCNEQQRRAALQNIARALRQQSREIFKANQLDLDAAKAQALSAAMIDRLELNEKRLEEMARSCEQIAEQEPVVGAIVNSHVREDGLKLAQQRIPIGVIGIIFESRPNVVVDCSALAIKSGNAVVLKGGKEASNTNKILGEIVQDAIAKKLPQDIIQVLDSTDREALKVLLTLRDEVDLIIPRGGEGLINFVYEHSKIPVIAHFKGLCHIYVHHDAELAKAVKICMNAKVQRPAVCNAMETLLVHEAIAPQFLKVLLPALQKEGVELRGDEFVQEIAPFVSPACPADWDMEYLDRILSIRAVANEDAAIEHIQQHGTRHTEAIIAKDMQVIEKFREAVDASCIVVNASTRFNDGGQLGLGAELGISTSKIHAYGPMGAREMTTLRYIVEGDGHLRS